VSVISFVSITTRMDRRPDMAEPSGRGFRSIQVARHSIIRGINLFGIPLAIRSTALDRVSSFDETLHYSAAMDFSIAVSCVSGGPFHISEPLGQFRVHAYTQRLMR
jgi:hypothetical protein